MVLQLFRAYTDFLEDLEEDQTTRQHVNIYKGENQFTIYVANLENALIM